MGQVIPYDRIMFMKYDHGVSITDEVIKQYINLDGMQQFEDHRHSWKLHGQITKMLTYPLANIELFMQKLIHSKNKESVSTLH